MRRCRKSAALTDYPNSLFRAPSLDFRNPPIESIDWAGVAAGTGSRFRPVLGIGIGGVGVLGML